MSSAIEAVMANPEAASKLSVDDKKKLLLTGIVADIFLSNAGAEEEASPEFAALVGTIDPRELPQWDVTVGPPSFEGLDEEQTMLAKVEYGRGPIDKILRLCMPMRANAALKLGTLKGLHPECQFLQRFCYAAQALCTYENRRRFFLQDADGLEILMMDFDDPIRRCPDALPHGPEGKRNMVKRTLPDVTQEEIDFIIQTDKGYSEEVEAAALANAPLLTCRFQHVLKGLPDSKDKMLSAYAAVDDGFVNAATVEAHAQGMGVVTLLADSAEEVRAAAALLTRNATLLSPAYCEHFAGLSPNHRAPVGEASAAAAGCFYRPSFLVPPNKVPERPPNNVCSNPACGKVETPPAAPSATLPTPAPTLADPTPVAAVAAPEPAALAKAEKFMVCTACKAAVYCSKACQKAHWPDHKHCCATEKTRLKMVAEARAAEKQRQLQQAILPTPPASDKGKKENKKGRGKRDKA